MKSIAVRHERFLLIAAACLVFLGGPLFAAGTE